MSPSPRTKLSSWAWRTWTHNRHGYLNVMNQSKPSPIYQINFLCMINHLLFESKCDLKLHKEDALPDIQLLVQILKARLNVLFNGSSLIGQLLENFFDQGQGI